MNEELNKEMEHVLEAMIDPRQMSRDDVEQVLSDPQQWEAADELRLLREALRTTSKPHQVDVEAEWAKFQRRPAVTQMHRARQQRRYWTIASVMGLAASVLIAVLLLWNPLGEQPTMVYQASNEVQRTMLLTSRGAYALDNADDKTPVENPDATELSEDERILVYDAAGAVANAAEPNVQTEVETHVLQTPRGEDFKVRLADGTLVWLNADSRLEYPSAFVGGERHVVLRGEAYFEVAHDEQHPFIIETPSLTTRVLGTEFNISCYSASNAHVTLVDGSLEVSRTDGSKTVRLKPGEDALLTADGSFEVKQVDTDYYLFWKEGFFYFDNVPLSDIMQSLGRWYNVTVVFDNEELMNDRMHFLCNRKEGLLRSIQVLNGMRKMEVCMEDNTVHVR